MTMMAVPTLLEMRCQGQRWVMSLGRLTGCGTLLLLYDPHVLAVPGTAVQVQCPKCRHLNGIEPL